MAGRIPRAFIDELVTRFDIVDIVDSRVKLKKKGRTSAPAALFIMRKHLHFQLAKKNSFIIVLAVVSMGMSLILSWLLTG